MALANCEKAYSFQLVWLFGSANTFASQRRTLHQLIGWQTGSFLQTNHHREGWEEVHSLRIISETRTPSSKLVIFCHMFISPSCHPVTHHRCRLNVTLIQHIGRVDSASPMS